MRLLLGPGLLSVIQNPILFARDLRRDVLPRRARSPLLVLIPYPLFMLIARAFGRAMHGSNLAVQEGLAELSSQLQETISGIAVVKAYAMEDAARRALRGRQRGALPARSSAWCA